jgi:hypothetical protein
MMWHHLRTALICLALLMPFAGRAQAPTGGKIPQTANPTPEIPTFYAHSRQVIVEADVWNPPNKNGKADTSLMPKKSIERPSGEAMFDKEFPNYPMPVRGLTSKDFHIFDNGVEQTINFLKEADFPAVNIVGEWQMDPTTRGTWGTFIGFDHVVGYWVPPEATYLTGYVPPPSKYGECHTIQVIVEGHGIDVNRNRYCGLKGSDEVKATNGEASLHSQMRTFANSAARETIKVSIQTFAFWSSGLLHLITEPPSVGKGAVLPATDFTYVVEVHDAKAPATVQIATEFVLPIKFWEGTDCRKKNPAVHVLGMVYKANGEAAAQFADMFPCLRPTTMRKQAFKAPLVLDEVLIPTRFNTQVELPPGDYELSVVVSDGKHFGRARLPLHVEAFGGKELSISDIALSNILRDSSWVAREAANVSPAPVVPTPLVSKNVQFFSAVDMRLPRHSPLSFYFEIYEPQLETETTAVYYSIRIIDLKTRSLVMNTGPMSAAEWVQPRSTVIPIGLKLAMDKLKKGSYRLEVQASDSAGGESEWRQATFMIE